MKDQMNKYLTQGLSNLSVTPTQHEAMFARIHHGEKQHVSFRRTMVLTVLIVMIAAAACAITVYELVKPKMDQIAAVVVNGDWDFDTKSRYIELMESFDFELDSDQLAIFRNTAFTTDVRSHAADLIIDAIYGDEIRAKLDPSIVQQEVYPMPDDETVFFDLYRKADPNADDTTIATAYEQWWHENYPSVKDVVVPQATVSTFVTPDALQKKCETYLSEVMNFNSFERQKCSITLSNDESNNIWIAHFSVSGNDLRETLKNEWVTDAYDAENQVYAWNVLFDTNGTLIGQMNLFDYLVEQLIPSEAYPDYDVWHDEYRAFLYCSTAERAAFSETWKPVVDQFLSEHPDAVDYYNTDSAYSTAYIVTRHVYGIPDDSVLSEEAAVDMAKAAYLSSGVEGVSPEMVNERCDHYALYDATNGMQPFWKVSFTHDVTNIKDGDHMGGYLVVIDASTGEILRQYVKSEQTISSPNEFAELFD